MPKPVSVEEYIAGQPERARAALRRARGVIRKAVPGLEETISYQIPAFKKDGQYVVYLAAWKDHYSLYPATERLLAALGDLLGPYRSHKATLRFPLGEPVPERLVTRVVKFMAKEAAERARAKAAKGKKR
jgi:uncharacterized protein YdhG (YjbR/CyaY superfamily)